MFYKKGNKQSDKEVPGKSYSNIEVIPWIFLSESSNFFEENIFILVKEVVDIFDFGHLVGINNDEEEPNDGNGECDYTKSKI